MKNKFSLELVYKKVSKNTVDIILTVSDVEGILLKYKVYSQNGVDLKGVPVNSVWKVKINSKKELYNKIGQYADISIITELYDRVYHEDIDLYHEYCANNSLLRNYYDDYNPEKLTEADIEDMNRFNSEFEKKHGKENLVQIFDVKHMPKYNYDLLVEAKEYIDNMK